MPATRKICTTDSPKSPSENNIRRDSLVREPRRFAFVCLSHVSSEDKNNKNNNNKKQNNDEKEVDKNGFETQFTQVPVPVTTMLNAARKMKAKGYSIEDIAEITGLTAEEIEGLYI